ncbi:HET domain-containing protein [Colletotrichum sojae]|uniref:HET domain-containing protein n=1 Tax=Colletotrichum sojae TaxID=2175907 RepID=A0A8H6IPN7_9PEZI|nr:HET domain-containing protein [Colletotrichum sojae]
MQVPNPYQYKPLASPRSIRLVVLHRRGKNEQAPGQLSCEVVEASVDNPPPYFALSYTWGGETPCEPLTVRGSAKSGQKQQLLITPNCAAALRVLQRSLTRKVRRRRVLRVWVDAICIDQACGDERNAQVAMMAEIYDRASKVVVWLGEDHAPATWSRLAGSKPLAMLPRVKCDYSRDLEDKMKRFAARMALRVCDGNALDRLKQSPYWTRVWTLKEFAHPKAVVLCRDSRLFVFSGLAHLLSVLPKDESAPSQQGLDLHVNLYEWQQHATTMARPFRAATNQLRRVLSMQASEPRDKIFALRALSPGVLGKMTVDYGQPVGEVFRAATRLMVEEEDSLRVLYFSNRRKTTPGVDWEAAPSWVVDFATEDTETRGSYRYYYNSLCAAAGGSKPGYKFTTDGMRLSLRGARLTRVGSLIGDLFPPKGECVQRRMCMVDEKCEMEKGAGRWFPHACDSPYLDVLGKFLADVTDAVEPGPELDTMDRSLCDLLRWIIQEPKKHGWSSSSSSLAAGTALRGMSAVSSLVEWDSLRCGGQCRAELRVGRLFFTEDGTAGLGVAGVREGDVVCLLAGMDHPFILQPSKGEEGRYRIVGPTVFSGAMRGEMWPVDDDEIEDFEIV